MEEKGNSESLLLHIEDFCPKQVARICHSKKHLTVRSKNQFEASTNQANKEEAEKVITNQGTKGNPIRDQTVRERTQTKPTEERERKLSGPLASHMT